MFAFPFAILQLAVAAILAARLKVAGSSLLIHHASHSRLLTQSRPNVVAADLIGVLTLNVPVADYRRDHSAHHSLRTFARAGDDPDAAFLHELGFEPGTPLRVLKRRFWWHVVSPRMHGRLTATRLRGTFFAGPPWRRAVAAAYWGGLAAAAAAGGWLLPLAAGFVAPLLWAGNVGAYMELTSRHRWMTGSSTGQERQFELSHGRYLGAMPPQGRNPLRWGAWVLRMAAAAIGRFAALPGDLPHHQFHHLGSKPVRSLDRYAWTNADQEFSPHVWADEALQRQSVPTLMEAVDRWLSALAAEPADTKLAAACIRVAEPADDSSDRTGRQK